MYTYTHRLRPFKAEQPDDTDPGPHDMTRACDTFENRPLKVPLSCSLCPTYLRSQSGYRAGSLHGFKKGLALCSRPSTKPSSPSRRIPCTSCVITLQRLLVMAQMKGALVRSTVSHPGFQISSIHRAYVHRYVYVYIYV